MNKSAIQRFAIQARKDLIDGVSQRAYQYGITKEGYGERNAVTVGGRVLTSDEQRQRKELVDQIVSKGYTQVMEEVAYTWFNRFIALRFMEVNNYLPSHIRVFSDSTGAFKPEILNDVLHLELPGLSDQQLKEFKTKVADYIETNQTEALYRYLLLTQCNALNESLPRMFERMGGFTELLLPNNILKPDSVLGRMVTEIPEEDWTDQVQIIGWLYQYYNTELKDDTFAQLKKNVKITKERIPSATQLFTPDWIVRYMVENSLGRLWIEGHPNDELKAGWKYYLDEAEQEADVQAQLDTLRADYANLKPQDIKVIDPCMGSGHILVYAFDVLVQIYKTYGISERDAARNILENNLYGLDIDDRAAQLAYFAVMMKARQYDRRIFSRGIQPHVYAIVESNGLDGATVEYFTNDDPKLKKDFKKLMEELRDAKEYGSILKVSEVDFAELYARVEEVRDDISIFREIVINQILPLIQVAEVMAQKYSIVVTNPPYMGNGSMNNLLVTYAKENYPDSKLDLFAMLMETCNRFTAEHGFYSLITMHSWMYLGSFERLREKILRSQLVNTLHLGSHAFDNDVGTIVQNAAFVICKDNVPEYKSVYIRLVDFSSSEAKRVAFSDPQLRYLKKPSAFLTIPGTPMAYWSDDKVLDVFRTASPLSEYGDSRSGLQTSDNNRFLRLWHEVSFENIGIGCINADIAEKSQKKWFPHTKGGTFRKWYGNLSYVVNWKNDGAEIKAFATDLYKSYSRIVKNTEYYFEEGITWSHTATKDSFGVRFVPPGVIFNVEAPTVFRISEWEYVLGLLNSKVASTILPIMNQTMHFLAGDTAKFPVVFGNESEMGQIRQLVRKNITLAKEDWDLSEISWEFEKHPLVAIQKKQIAEAVYAVRESMHNRAALLLQNERKLTSLFLKIYGFDSLKIQNVKEEDLTVRDDSATALIKSLISYAVGCMFGRYSLDVPGLAYAGGEWDATKYKTFIPDKDNIIPICDDDYFDDDIVGRFVKWVETVYGSETLEENLKYIAVTLGGKGTAREVIRNYFINNFYSDHCNLYSVTGSGKRPIYWLFDSGKKNGFKALIYMHRYQSDLLARMRTDYVHEQQERYHTQLSHLTEAAEHASAAEGVKLKKQIKKIQEQALEIQKYEEKIHHLADQNISIDLDDGVKHNYALFGDVLAKIK